MLRIIFLTLSCFVMVYVWIYSVDCRIDYPYTPFKLMKQNTFYSKYLIRLCICKDKKRGMINFTFFLEMLAHLLLLSSLVLLVLIYCNKWCLDEGVYEVYRVSIILIMSLIFTVPLTIAGAIHDYMTKNVEKESVRNKKKRKK